MNSPSFDNLLMHILTFMPMPLDFGKLLYPYVTKLVTYNKMELVLKPGEIANMAYWPITGYLRTYTKFKPEEDRELFKQKTIDISIPGKIFMLADSFINQVDNKLYMEIAKGSTIWGISYASFKALENQVPEMKGLAIKVLANRESDWYKKMEMCKVKNKQGYEEFLDLFGKEIEDCVQQQEIASYIGMRPEELSRMKK